MINIKADELFFKYKVRSKHKLGFKEFTFYATTDIEEFLNRNNIEYVRDMIHPFIKPYFTQLGSVDTEFIYYDEQLDIE